MIEKIYIQGYSGAVEAPNDWDQPHPGAGDYITELDHLPEPKYMGHIEFSQRKTANLYISNQPKYNHLAYSSWKLMNFIGVPK